MTTRMTAQQWIRTKDNRTGRQLAVAVPSASTPNKFHLTTATSCDCRGFQFRRTCRHLEAVRAEIAARQAPKPVADRFVSDPPIDGNLADLARRQKLAAMATDIWGHDGEGS
jgi:hypothetical protein